jgi:hypothetical protein
MHSLSIHQERSVNTFLRWAAMMVIAAITDQALDKGRVERVKNFIVEQANQAISNAIKHERAPALIKEMAEDLSDVVVDWVIRTILWVARATGQIEVK